MTGTVLVDAGPLIALVDRRDQWHEWSKKQFAAIAPPLLTCEAVLTEACFVAARITAGAENVIGLFRRGVAALEFSASAELPELDDLMRRYCNVPMSLADACLVRMSELMPDSTLLTLDADFQIYRKHRRRKIALRLPGDQT